MQIVRLKTGPALIECEAEEALFGAFDIEDLNQRTIIIDINSFNIDLRAIHDTLYPPRS